MTTTFHVVYTAGTTTVLLPFAYSLLQTASARFLLVDNGCAPDESERMKRIANAETRFSYYRLPFDHIVRHGIALDHLFERTNESTFAIIDSDILATGDFLAELTARPAGSGAICTGWPVWIEDEEAICASGQPFLGGPYRTLVDGTAAGGTGCALYDRDALDAALRFVEVGFGNRTGGTLDEKVRRAFAGRGWDFARYGTARIAHLGLALQGNEIVNRDCRTLHHLGGLSHAADVAPRRVHEKWKRTAAIFLRGERASAINIVANVKQRLSRDGIKRARMYARKKQIVVQVSSWMQSLGRGESVPPMTPTDSAEVDARLARLRDVLVRDYPAYLDRMRAADRPGRSA